jgi:hypothetical protein
MYARACGSVCMCVCVCVCVCLCVCVFGPPGQFAGKGVADGKLYLPVECVNTLSRTSGELYLPVERE